jgi:hypothetical protein
VTLAFSPKIDRTYLKPKLELPPGACDCHFHFIGPQKQFLSLLKNFHNAEKGW